MTPTVDVTGPCDHRAADGRSRPLIEDLLPAASRALASELGQDPGDVQVVGGTRRSYSSVWELHAGSGSYILKRLPYRAERELELTQLTRRLFDGVDFVRTPRIACCPTPDTFLVEKIPGLHLRAACTSPPWQGVGRWLDSRCALLSRVGAWLATFHGASLSMQRAPLAGVKEYVRRREAGLMALDGHLRDRFLRALDEGVSEATVRVHGDFAPHNILVDGDTISVIDFAGINEFDYETRWFDVAGMVVGLEEAWRARLRNHLRLFRSAVDAMIGAFLRTCGGSVEDTAFPICYAVRHFTRINRYCQAGRPPGPWNWHVRRLRLALEQPDAIRRLGRG